MGAHDFYHKPIDDDILTVIVNRAFVLANLERENEQLKQFSLDGNGFIGNSPKIQQVCRLVERIAPTDISTLLLGESGTGKEVIAHSIHNLSATLSAFYFTLCGFMGTGKGAFFVTEQFTFQQVFRNRGTVNGHKRLLTAGTQIMNRMGNYLFPCATFSQ